MLLVPGWGENLYCFCVCGIRSVFFLTLLFLFYFFNLYLFNSGRVVLQKSQEIVAPLGCYRHILPPRVPIPGVLRKCGERWGRVKWWMTGMIMEVKSMVWVQNLDGGEMLRFKREGILVCVVMVVVLGVVFFRAHPLSVTELECSGVSFWLWEEASSNWVEVL